MNSELLRGFLGLVLGSVIIIVIQFIYYYLQGKKDRKYMEIMMRVYMESERIGNKDHAKYIMRQIKKA